MSFYTVVATDYVHLVYSNYCVNYKCFPSKTRILKYKMKTNCNKAECRVRGNCNNTLQFARVATSDPVPFVL